MIEPAAGGYRLVLDGNRIDSQEFMRLSRGASDALGAGDARRASELEDQALSLWRGPVLAGISDEPAVRAEVAALQERRLQVLETRAEAELALDHYNEVIADCALRSRGTQRGRICSAC